MGYPAPPESPRTRPGVVKAAVNLLYLGAALEIISAIVAMATYGPTRRGYEKAFAGTSTASAAGVLAISVIATAIFAVIVAVILIVLATLNARGSNVARIITWVFGGLALCCSGSALTLGLAGNSFTRGMNTSGGPSSQQIQDAVRSELPSWITPTSTALAVIFLLALLASLILLALPASNAYFAKRTQQAQWEPPMPPVPGA